MLVIFFLLCAFVDNVLAVPDKNLPKKKELCLDYKSDFKITSYNVWGLPVTLPGHDDDKRFPLIAEALIKLSPDILCLQEVFSTQFRHLNLPELLSNYYYYSDYTCNQSIVPWVQRDCHGGLATFSRYPILEEHFSPFPHVDGMRWEEKLGAKGCLLSKIDLPTGMVWVVNTHLYSGPSTKDESIRMAQIKIMENAIQNLQTNLPVVVAGDLNIAHHCLENNLMVFPKTAYSYLQQQMNLMDAVENYSIENQFYTIDPQSNVYCDSAEGAQKLDYVFYKNGKYRQFKVLQNSVEMKGAATLSDHHAFSTIFKI